MLYFSDISIFVWRTKHNSVDFGYGVFKKEIFNLIKVRQTAENRIIFGGSYENTRWRSQTCYISQTFQFSFGGPSKIVLTLVMEFWENIFCFRKFFILIEIRQTPENRIIFGGSYEPSNLVFYLENHAAGDKSLNKMFGSQNFGPIRREWACSIGRKFVLKTETFKIHTLNFVTQFNILPQTQVIFHLKVTICVP